MQCVVFRHVQALLLYILCLFLYNILYLQNNFPRFLCFRRKIRFEINRCCPGAIWRYAVMTLVLGARPLGIAAGGSRTEDRLCTVHITTLADTPAQLTVCAQCTFTTLADTATQLTGCAQCTLPHWQTQQHSWESVHSAHYHTGRNSNTADRLCTVHITTLADTAAQLTGCAQCTLPHWQTQQHTSPPC